jgi:hypothetical protein
MTHFLFWLTDGSQDELSVKILPDLDAYSRRYRVAKLALISTFRDLNFWRVGKNVFSHESVAKLTRVLSNTLQLFLHRLRMRLVCTKWRKLGLRGGVPLYQTRVAVAVGNFQGVSLWLEGFLGKVFQQGTFSEIIHYVK